MQEQADHLSDRLTIQLMIGKQLHPITIRREMEEIFRKAARNINERLSRYQESYPSLGYERCMAITLLDFAVEALQAAHDSSAAPYDAAVRGLTHEIEQALGLSQEPEVDLDDGQ